MKYLVLLLLLPTIAFAATTVPKVLNPCKLNSSGKPVLAAWKAANCS